MYELIKYLFYFSHLLMITLNFRAIVVIIVVQTALFCILFVSLFVVSFFVLSLTL
jgi:hypothetical protein